MRDAPAYSLLGKRVWVAGHRGLVGSALVRRLSRESCELLTVDRAELDLTRQAEVEAWVDAARPEAIFLAAAKVGGVLANATRPADFLYENLAIQIHVLEAARRVGVPRLMVLGSSCIYPRLAHQPIVEDALMTGPLEPTNEAYAIAKIAGLKQVEAYRRQHGLDWISAMPTNLYGPHDNFDLETGHVLAALIRKAHEAKVAGAPTLTIWGSGQARREFLHVDDCADALVLLIRRYSNGAHINVGSGEDMTILDLAKTVCDVVGFEGEIVCDRSKPDGTPRKLMSGARLRALGWSPRIGLRTGLQETYGWFLKQIAA